MFDLLESCKEILNKEFATDFSRDREELLWLKQGVRERIERRGEEDFSSAKVRGTVYLLENAPLRLHEEELFALRIAHGYYMQDVKLENRRRVRQRRRTAEVARLEEKNAFKAELDFGHISPDWAYLLQRGFGGVCEDLAAEQARHAADGRRAYYSERIAVYRAIQGLCRRFAEEAAPTPKGRFVAENLLHLAQKPPQTMAQALQLMLLYYVLQTHVDTVIVRSLGALDRLLLPFYRADLESGRFTREQLREILKTFFYTVSQMRVTANMPFSVGGMEADGKDATNELSFVLLECYRELEIYDPKMHVMYHPGLDQRLTDLVFTMIREGKNSFVFMNTPLAVRALEGIGIAPEDARRITVYGCYEPAAEATEIPCTCAGMMNLVAAAERVLQGGEEFSCFEDLMARVLDEVEFLTRQCMDTLVAYEGDFAQVCPSLMMSPTFQSSREQGVDVYEGGAKYNNTSVVGAGLATLTDSLAAIKQTVFEQKRVTLARLREILKDNWQGEEPLRQEVEKRCAHFGNHRDEADGIAVRIYERFASVINGRKNGRGGVFRCGMFSVDWRRWMGKTTLATPDGRRAGEPISKNLAPCIGQDKMGVTAYLQSVLKLDGQKMPDGGVADVVLHGSAVEGEEGLAALRALVVTFMNKGGFGIHCNVLRPEQLRQAQREPQNYRNLQVRVCGWNARFVELDANVQEEFIRQAETGR